MKRDQQLKIKMSVEEKQLIENAAQMYGGSMSDYARKKLLTGAENLSDGRRTQELVAALCKLCRITERIEDENLRKDLEQVEVELWQRVK